MSAGHLLPTRTQNTEASGAGGESERKGRGEETQEKGEVEDPDSQRVACGRAQGTGRNRRQLGCQVYWATLSPGNHQS